MNILHKIFFHYFSTIKDNTNIWDFHTIYRGCPIHVFHILIHQLLPVNSIKAIESDIPKKIHAQGIDKMVEMCFIMVEKGKKW